MILATKSGWLIAVSLVRETPKAFIVKARDERRGRRVPKGDQRQKLFSNTTEAMAWQAEDLQP